MTQMTRQRTTQTSVTKQGFEYEYNEDQYSRREYYGLSDKAVYLLSILLGVFLVLG